MNINDFLSKLKIYKNSLPGQYITNCPVCGDTHHLFLTEKNDKILVYCQKCNAGFTEIVKILDIPFDSSEEPPKIIEEYDHVYKNTDGSIAYYKTRQKFSNGKKKFTFYHLDENGKKQFSKPKFCNNLYNLDCLENAYPQDILYIVEGEKCADAMAERGFLVTTTNTGAGGKLNLSGTDRRLLDKFKEKIVIPDNDDAGTKYADNFPDAKILKLSDIWENIRSKQDIADFLKAGHDINLIKNYQFEVANNFEELTKDDLISAKLFDRLLKIKDTFEHTQAVTKCENRASELKYLNSFKNNFKQYKISLAMKNQNAKGNQTNFIDQPIKLFCGDWIADGFGVKKNEISKASGEVSVKFASSIPILPTEILENQDSGEQKIQIAYFSNKKWKTIVCERSTIANQNRIVNLSDKGVDVTTENAKLLVKYISDCVNKNIDVLPIYKSISRLGWVNNKFVPYAENIKFDGEKDNKFLFESVSQAGSYEKWVEKVKELRKNIYLRLSLCASFASPIIEKVNGLPFVFHLWGSTGAGKTVALMVAMSIWGNPKMGKMVRTMNMTANSMLSTAAFLCNLPFAGDELQTIKNRWENYDNLIMKITEGIDRGRMNYDKNNELKTWKNSFLFTGEEPCIKFSSGGGAKNRVIEVECVNDVVSDGNSVVSFINQNYGHAGRLFIDILNNEKNLHEQYTEIFNSITKLCDTTDKQAMSMAFILLADKLSCKYIFEDNPLTIENVKEYLISNKDIDTATRSYEYLINFIARNQVKFEFNQYSMGEMWGRIDGEYIYINKDVLIKELSNVGFEFDAVKRKWANKGYLIKNSQGKMVHQTKCFGIKGNYIKIKGFIEEIEIDDTNLAFEEL